MLYEQFKRNFQSRLVNDLLAIAEAENIPHDRAFCELAAQYLGYDVDSIVISDGRDDNGIDFYNVSGTTYEIFQCKMHRLISGVRLNTRNFGGEGVSDLSRALDFMLSSDEPSGNSNVRQLKSWWDNAFSSLQSSAPIPDDKLRLELNLVVLGNGLTRGATQQFNVLRERIANLDQQLIEIICRLITLDDLVKTYWEQNNFEWKDVHGNPVDTIQLTPEYFDNRPSMLEVDGCIIAYVQAADLVKAYSLLGQQLFEPNVRCEIPKSHVNTAIQETASDPERQSQFKYLNNGVTIVTNNYWEEKNEDGDIVQICVKQPGIINGYQTVAALTRTYERLDSNAKSQFKQKCYVMIRILLSDRVSDISELVKASNLQNEMKPRNFVSNNPEQDLYERLFAQDGWFYQRKDGSWEAFQVHHKMWRNLPNSTPNDFLVEGTRNLYRIIDNEDLAQIWLAFIGFCREAINRKKDLFRESKGLYRMIFQEVPRQHADAYDYKIDEAEKMSEAPSYLSMLVSYLSSQFVKAVIPSPQANRSEAIQRLDLSDDLVREQLDAKLFEDDEYSVNHVLNNMTFALIELFGYVLWRSFREDWIDNSVATHLLSFGTYAELKSNPYTSQIREKFEQNRYNPEDIPFLIFAFIRNMIMSEIRGPWKSQYLAQSRVRFLHNPSTRSFLTERLEEWNESYGRQQLLPDYWLQTRNPFENFYELINRLVRSREV